MNAQVHKAQVSIYTLKDPRRIDEAILRFWQLLRQYPRLSYRASALSTLIWGPPDDIWHFLHQAYTLLQKDGLLMDIKITAQGPDPEFFAAPPQ